MFNTEHSDVMKMKIIREFGEVSGGIKRTGFLTLFCCVLNISDTPRSRYTSRMLCLAEDIPSGLLSSGASLHNV